MFTWSSTRAMWLLTQFFHYLIKCFHHLHLRQGWLRLYGLLKNLNCLDFLWCTSSAPYYIWFELLLCKTIYYVTEEGIFMFGYEFGNFDMIVPWQKYLPMRPMGSGAGYWCGRLQSPFLVRVSTLVTIWEFQRFPPSTNITSNTLPFVELSI